MSNNSKKSKEAGEHMHLFMESLDEDLQNLEKRLNQEFTRKIANTVDKIGMIIKKQETRISKLSKRFNGILMYQDNMVRASGDESRGRSSHLT